MLKSLLSIFFILVSFTATKAQSSGERITNWLEQGRKVYHQKDSIPNLISFYAEKQIGIPYKAGLLDHSPKEKLVSTLKGSDCVIYVETTLALTLTTIKGDTSYDAFRRNLQFIRYRNGILNGYYSRLHYFSDWLLNNQKKGDLTIITQKWKGVEPVGKIDFMSHHLKSYPKLAASDSLLKLMEHREALLSRDHLKYLPKKYLPFYIEHIQTGDIIAFVTTVPGLDVSHTAIAYKNGAFITFLHANPRLGVTAEPLGLLAYVYSRKTIKGIIVARFRDTPAS